MVVLAAALALQFACVRIEHARLADEVQGKICVRQLFFELGIRGDHFNHPLTEHQRVIAESRYVSEQCVFLVHRFSTPSGIS